MLYMFTSIMPLQHNKETICTESCLYVVICVGLFVKMVLYHFLTLSFWSTHFEAMMWQQQPISKKAAKLLTGKNTNKSVMG